MDNPLPSQTVGFLMAWLEVISYDVMLEYIVQTKS